MGQFNNPSASRLSRSSRNTGRNHKQKQQSDAPQQNGSSSRRAAGQYCSMVASAALVNGEQNKSELSLRLRLGPRLAPGMRVQRQHDVNRLNTASRYQNSKTLTTTASNTSTQSTGALAGLVNCRALSIMMAGSLLLLIANSNHVQAGEQHSARVTYSSSTNNNNNNRQATDETKAALEAELNMILQQEQQPGSELAQDTNSKLLSEAIISRLMLGNLSDISTASLPSQRGTSSESGDLDGGSPLATTGQDGPNSAPDNQDQAAAAASSSGPTFSQPEVARLRRVLNYLQAYEMAQAMGGLNGDQYPVLPASQAATIKRASMKMGNYLARQQNGAGQRQLSGYNRVNSFDFGLGKRPDASVAGNILRFGDSAIGGGHLAAVSGSGLGKRPSAHRYDFGLGKRVPAYPRFDFGLGKRAPNRIRYDFGLGK